MTKFLVSLVVGIMILTPALVAAGTGSTGSGSGATSGSGSTPSGTSGATGSGSGTSSGTPSSGSGTSSPSASPSPSSGSTSGDFSQYLTQADCEKAGGMWQASANKCAKK
jgi:hypothetical protein